MSYQDYISLCEKAYLRMIGVGYSMVAYRQVDYILGKGVYFVDCEIVSSSIAKLEEARGKMELSQEEIMGDCNAMSELLAFGIREALNAEKKMHLISSTI